MYKIKYTFFLSFFSRKNTLQEIWKEQDGGKKKEKKEKTVFLHKLFNEHAML